MVKRLLLPLLAAAALAVPATAVAKVIEVNGPISLVGRLIARGDLERSSSARPVEMRFRRGLLRVVDVGGDTKVSCKARRSGTRTNDEGQTVFLCAGPRGAAEISGSHFHFQLLAARFGIKVPEGYTGKIGGRIHEAGEGSDESDGDEARPAEPTPVERPAPDERPAPVERP